MSTTEILEIKQLARQFAEAELRPHVEQWDHDARIDESALAQLAELGFFGMLIPEAYGGMEFDLPTYVAVLEELAWGEPAVAYIVATTNHVARTIMQHGSDEQQRRWLEPMARGETIACIAVAEEAAGSDVTALSTRAQRAGDGWTITGEKKWVSNGRSAQLALVLARAGNDALSAFLVPTDAAGYQVGERATTMGFRPLEVLTVKLDGVRVAAEDELQLPPERINQTLGMAAIAVGIAQAALDHAVGYADIREQFQTKLRDFEGLQFKLAEMATRVASARALLLQAAADPTEQNRAMAKYLATENAMWVTTNAVQIYGGYGYMRDYPVEKLMRDAKATELLEGANELHKVLIARELYEQPE
ncbi:MAG TPA: acyl-CoA dehydrogenase family protein [Longimicrobiales bacterium]|nr:acyl-CoA dehydrogenase family protein [Longimicrobiales bacterium]